MAKLNMLDLTEEKRISVLKHLVKDLLGSPAAKTYDNYVLAFRHVHGIEPHAIEYSGTDSDFRDHLEKGLYENIEFLSKDNNILIGSVQFMYENLCSMCNWTVATE